MVESVLTSNAANDGVHHALAKTDNTYAAALVPYGLAQMNPNDKDRQKIGLESKWTLVDSKAAAESFIDAVKSLTEYNSLKADDLREGLHSLADALPQLGATVDIIWFMDKAADFHGDLMIFGGLKRLQQWNDASISLLHATAKPDTMPRALTDWINSLCCQMSSVDDYQRHCTLWQGSILITGSEKCLKLPGFRLECTECDASSQLNLKSSKKAGCILSPTLNFVAEVDFDDVPALYLTDYCYRLNLVSQSTALRKSQQFLYQLTTAPNLCYILRLYYGSSWKDASNCRTHCDENKKKKSKSWKELVKENILHAVDNPNKVELDGKLGCFHLLVRAVQVRNKSEGNNFYLSYDFVAQQMCDVTDICGSVGCAVSASDAALKNVSFVGDLTGKSFLPIRQSEDAVVTEVKSLSDYHLQQEQQLLASNSDDNQICPGKDTFGRLTPPKKQKAVVLNASEIVKYFNTDGTAARQCSGMVMRKKSMHRTYNSEERDCGSAKQSWPSCLQSRCHDVYYNIRNAEQIEKESARLKSRLGGHETLSTCASHQKVESLLLSMGGASRKRATKTGFHLPVRNSETSNGKDFIAARKRKSLDGDWYPVSDSESQKVVNSPKRHMGALNRSMSNAAAEPRSLRNKRKMEDAVKEMLCLYAVEPSNELFAPCFKRLCTITESFVKDLPTSRGLREEVHKLTQKFAEHVIEFERQRQEHLKSEGK